MGRLKKPSQAMLKTLRALAEWNDWKSCYELRGDMNTLYALKNRGLVEQSAMRFGDSFSPHTNIEWRITQAGKDYLAQWGGSQ